MKTNLMTILALILAILFSGCAHHVPAETDTKVATSDFETEERIVSNKITYMSSDWLTYPSLQALEEKVTDIYEGKVTNILFDIVDLRTGTSIKDPLADEKTAKNGPRWELWTVYEIEVSSLYKGKDTAKKYICFDSALEGYEEEKQRELMKSAGIYRDEVGLMVMDGYTPLEIGESYIFFTVDKGSEYSYIPNPEQFSFHKTRTDKNNGFEYKEVEDFCKKLK